MHPPKLSKLGFNLQTNNLDIDGALLYRIYVQDKENGAITTIYVGQTKNGMNRPFQRYDLNIHRLLEDKPPLNGKQYRPVHYDLKAAHLAGHQITIELLRNVDLANEVILDAELEMQRLYGVEPIIKTKEMRKLSDLGGPVA
jgi:hypothetical protein